MAALKPQLREEIRGADMAGTADLNCRVTHASSSRKTCLWERPRGGGGQGRTSSGVALAAFLHFAKSYNTALQERGSPQ